MTSVQRLLYINSTGADVRITLEPWADQYLIHPGQTVEIVVRGDPNAGEIEFEQDASGLVIHGYTGSVVDIFSDGVELTPVEQI
jgi:hypothetical protein